MAELLQVKDTMRSLDIAELTGKRHADVMRDIRNLLEQGVNERNFALVDYADKKGEKRPCYDLTPKGVLILASGYDAVLREKIINRLEELETARRNAERPTLPNNRTERTLARMRNTHHYTKADGDREVAEVCRRLYGDTPHPAKGNRHRADYERAAGCLVFIKYGVPVTTSLTIARLRGTGHNNTLKTIRKIAELNPALSGDVTESYYIARAMGIHGRGKQRQPMLLLTRRALALYIMRTKRMKPGTLQPIIDAFDRAEADIAKNKASEGQADLFNRTGAQPLPPTPTPPTPMPPVAAATPTQGDMAERMIAAMAVLTGADIKKVQDIMRKGGAL